ncbi:hypothetical protein C3432_10435 [Citrobacter amalonaticus]|uniref:DUF4760 domain-containing protein n=2 Tax=Citrobacter amalonaticus TaxID=35703 RepID=A0A2S4S080_CITAM|nr:hypothetical protein C3432_10435 [Citrobacter amalonaticus]POT76165.1 hypothetical protein C3436_01385 [Citrobacter amalonaticus]POU66837.1 hypothetical protein C3430_08635 [Citrobacter amalonaticus]POV05400.1 hypothetical protein C3424_08690 [Citrobacter amalonaticus]
MLAAFESARWAYWSVIVSASAAFISLITVVVAFFALRTWRDEAIETAKREWKRSIINLIMRLTSSFGTVTEQRADLYFEFHKKDLHIRIDASVACWSSLLVALEQKPRLRRKILKKYAKPYMELIEMFDKYENGETTRDEILVKVQELYVFPPELNDYF